ncbi:MAG TPA: transposase [Actinomycetes bacterium]|nr:transposase [Actinomycetes bacterium]
MDTHADTLAVAIAAASGVILAEAEFPATGSGIEELIGFALRQAPGPELVFAVEGTRSYGIGLARAVTRLGMPVIELERPARAERRGRGKTDAIDAVLGARRALGADADALPTPRCDGDREALRILLVARQEMTSEKTAKTNRLIALLRGGSDTDRDLVRAEVTAFTLTRIARRRARRSESREERIRREDARRLAVAVTELEQQLSANKKQLQQIVHQLSPGLLERVGIGPVSAARAIVAWSHLGRCRSEAAFANLAGAAPIPASSGKVVRHRLNRGGDRQLNRALHDIAFTRMRCCPGTRAYVARRRAEGLSEREIRRCLKRYIARELFRALNTAAAS